MHEEEDLFPVRAAWEHQEHGFIMNSSFFFLKFASLCSSITRCLHACTTPIWPHIENKSQTAVTVSAALAGPSESNQTHPRERQDPWRGLLR